MSIRTDLPKSIRVERAKLAHDVYLMKKRKDFFDVRLREKAISVWIEVKVNEKDEWKPHK